MENEKKSGSCNRKLKKARADEESKLGAFMTNFLTTQSASTVSSDSGLVMTDDVLEVTPVLMQSPMSPRENIEVPGETMLHVVHPMLLKMFLIQSHQW